MTKAQARRALAHLPYPLEFSGSPGYFSISFRRQGARRRYLAEEATTWAAAVRQALNWVAGMQANRRA